MSSYRNHRIVIASLFLPESAVLGEGSEPATPALRLPPSVPNLLFAGAAGSPQPKSPNWRPVPGPLKSIVDDLKDKVCAPLS